MKRDGENTYLLDRISANIHRGLNLYSLFSLLLVLTELF